MTVKTSLRPLLLAATLMAGCASAPPPRAGLTEAESAIARATQAHAADLAPVEIDFANRQLAAAQAAFSQRDYLAAAALAAQAEANADLAAAKSRAATARIQIQQRSAENAALRRELLGESGGKP